MTFSITLASTGLYAEVDAASGGRVARLRSIDGLELLYPLEAIPFSPVHWPKGGIYPLIPYSNRIRHSRLHFDGRTYQLPLHPDAKPHTLHGVAQTLPWQVARVDAQSATLTVCYSGPQWPWSFSAVQNLCLQQNTLSIELSLTNTSDMPMPAGLGIHPYVPFVAGDVAEFRALERWVTDSDALPTGERRALSDLSTWKRGGQSGLMESEKDEDKLGYFAKWDGTVLVRRSAGTLTVRVLSSTDQLVMFAPALRDYLCVEPVTHVADGFNLFSDGQSGTGTEILAPGKTARRFYEIRWYPI